MGCPLGLVNQMLTLDCDDETQNLEFKIFIFASILNRKYHRNEASTDEEWGEEATKAVEKGAEDGTQAEPSSECCVNKRVNKARVVGKTVENIMMSHARH